MEILKLILNIFVLIFPLIFKKGIPYDEGIKKLNELISKKQKEFGAMNEDERTVALSNLLDDVKRVLELRK